MAFAGLGEVAKFGVDVLFGTGDDDAAPRANATATAAAADDASGS